MAEMPHLEKEIWQRFKAKPFVVLAIGREHKNEELKDFAKKHQLTFDVAGDPDRAVYGKYATMYIPRNYLIDTDGKIIFQEMGYSQEGFDQLITAIEKALKK
jgi:peroxiredoxin